jgi:uncharacterized Zn finger protein
LTEDDICARVGPQSYERGMRYFRSGMIFDARRQGSTLKARCRGSQGGPYRLEVTLGPEGVQSAHCSCPVGGGGYCKHIAALLLTWREKSDEFAEREELDETLERRSKAELIALVRQMLRHEPDLEWLLETPLPAAGKSHAPVDPAIYRRQAAAVFNNAEDEWGVEGDITDSLLAIKEIGDGFLAQHDFAGATAVYSAILEAVLKNYETYQDEDGDLGSIMGQCVVGLGQCLAPEAISPEARASGRSTGSMSIPAAVVWATRRMTCCWTGRLPRSATRSQAGSGRRGRAATPGATIGTARSTAASSSIWKQTRWTTKRSCGSAGRWAATRIW